MFFEVIATLIAGVAGAGAVMLVNKITGGRLPKWVMPMAAAAAMVAITINNEYGWFSRTIASYPAELEVVDRTENRTWFRPWTYAKPYVERFVAVDQGSIATHPDHEGLRMADVYLVGRWAPVHRVPILVDCEGGRRAALTDDIGFDPDGTVTGVIWDPTPNGDAIVATLCGAG